MEKTEQAIDAFIEALNQNPFLWSAWLELCLIICHKDDFSDGLEYLSRINDHWMKNFYFACLMLENLKIQKTYEEYCFGSVIGLFCFFRESVYLMNQLAHIFYHNQDQQISLEIFEILLKKDPYRTENLDTYSNILYVKEKHQELGALAVHCFENNKYCPETCCVVGNYHSLISEHEKAISFFKKALELDRNFLSACTLIGHEFLEMKLIPNAIDAYNSALNIDPKDFRAWYGLGQAYELQNLIQFSLNYFSKAVKSRPRDYRMWTALAINYQRLERNEEATRCYEHSEFYKDIEGIALFNLGKMYNVLGYEEKAVACFEDIVKQKDEAKVTDEVKRNSYQFC